MQCFLGGDREWMERMEQVSIWASGRHTSSHSPLSGTPVPSGTEGQIGKLFQTQSQFAAVPGAVWCYQVPGLMLISIFICPGLARKGNWHVIPSWGDWEGEGRGTVSMPKGPRGLPAMGFACLREWFPWRLHAWVWLCLSTREFWSLRKRMGVGGWRDGWGLKTSPLGLNVSQESFR